MVEIHGPDYGLARPPVIHQLEHPAGNPLQDIRTSEENDSAARQILALVSALASRCGRMHGLVAGGRRTMSLYLALAFQLYGRVDDRLYHVLVPEEVERDPSFFFPTPERPVRIDLAELPYIRLRDLGREVGGVGTSLDTHLALLQARVSSGSRPPTLSFRDTREGDHRILVNDMEVRCERRDFSLWREFARLRIHCRQRADANGYCDCCFLSAGAIPPSWAGWVVPGNEKDTALGLRPACSRIRRAMDLAGIPRRIQHHVHVLRAGRRGESRYGIALTAEWIDLGSELRCGGSPAGSA
jgi:hypothetical protein